MKRHILLLLAGVLVVIFACVKHHDPVPPPDTLKGIVFDKDTLSIYAGQVTRVSIQPTPSNYNRNLLTWKSADTTILSVTDSGTVTAKKEGTSKITVSNKGNTVSASCLVTVKDLKGIVLDKNTMSLYVSQGARIGIQLTPSNYNRNLLIWKSSDTNILSVTDSGTVTAKKAGTSKITVSNKNNTVSASCLVTVIALPPANPDSLKLELIACYPLNNSTDDLSGHGYHGIGRDITSVPDRFNKPNTAYYFNGKSSSISVYDNTTLRLLNTDFTLNAWVKLETYNNSITNGPDIISKKIHGANGGWGLGISGVFPKQGTAYSVTGGYGTTVLGLGQWYMVTAVYNINAKQARLYINGVLDVTTDHVDPPNSANNSVFQIGAGDGSFFQGQLDDIRIYGRAISTIEMLQLLNATN